MLNGFFEGLLLGFGAAMPLGPINILIMNRALRSYPQALATGMGAMSADGLYLGLILFGMASVFQGVLLSAVLGVFGALFLFFLAYRIFQSRDNEIGKEGGNEPKRSLGAIYLQGFALTFVNPYTVAFWLSMAGYVAKRELDPMMTLAGMFTAIGLWTGLMPYIVHRSKHKIPRRVIYALNVFSALLMAGFGIVIVVELFRKMM